MILSIKELNYKGTKKKSRKGTYLLIKFKDNDGNIRKSTLKKNKFTEQELKLYINRLSHTKKGTKQVKKEYVLVNETIKAKEQKQEFKEKKEKGEIEPIERNTREYYKRRLESTTNTLLDDNHRLTKAGYMAGCNRIIMALKNDNPDINKLSVENYKEVLEDYIRGNKGYKNINGVKRTFINDVIFKWASEFKKWD